MVASIHSLVFDTTSESAYVTKNIESHCPIVPLYWWCLQSNNYDHEPFMFCAATFVLSRNALPSFLICCHQQLINSRRSLANRKGSIHAETGEKWKQHQWAPSASNKSFGNPKTLIGQNNFPKFCHWWYRPHSCKSVYFCRNSVPEASVNNKLTRLIKIRI